jgi:hypothetical protein
MKTRLALTALAVAGLAGCASTPPPEPRATQRIDHVYVNLVDHKAARMGTRVYWVNPPLKKADRKQNEQP